MIGPLKHSSPFFFYKHDHLIQCIKDHQLLYSICLFVFLLHLWKLLSNRWCSVIYSNKNNTFRWSEHSFFRTDVVYIFSFQNWSSSKKFCLFRILYHSHKLHISFLFVLLASLHEYTQNSSPDEEGVFRNMLEVLVNYFMNVNVFWTPLWFRALHAIFLFQQWEPDKGSNPSTHHPK